MKCPHGLWLNQRCPACLHAQMYAQTNVAADAQRIWAEHMRNAYAPPQPAPAPESAKDITSEVTVTFAPLREGT